MKKPEALEQLIEELGVEHRRSEVETTSDSSAIIHLDDSEDAPEAGIHLSARECRLLLADRSTVERLIEALDSPDASISLFDVTVSADVQDALERGFLSVDEG